MFCYGRLKTLCCDHKVCPKVLKKQSPYISACLFYHSLQRKIESLDDIRKLLFKIRAPTDTHITI